MIVRPLTFLTGIIFAVSGAYLFMVKHQSQSLENRLGQLAQTSRMDEQAIRVLKAQWALEADPSRIAMLATEFTQLKPMKPGQLVTLAALTTDLPAPGSAAPYSNPEDLVPAMPGEGQGAPTPSGPAIQVRARVASAASTTPASAVVKPELADNQMSAAAQALPAPPPAPPMVHLAAYHHVVRPTVVNAVLHRRAEQREPQERRHAVILHEAVLPAPRSYAHVIQTRAEAVMPRPTQPLGARVLRVRAVAQVLPRHDAVSTAPLDGGSLLGMAQGGSQN